MQRQHAIPIKIMISADPKGSALIRTDYPREAHETSLKHEKK